MKIMENIELILAGLIFIAIFISLSIHDSDI